MTRIILFSDLHYAPERPVDNGSVIDRKLTEFSDVILDALIDKINNDIKPDLVLNLGDLVEDFNDHDKDIENTKYIWERFKAIKSPFYSCIGNHDLRTMTSRREIEEIMEYDHSTFSFDINGLHVIMLGTFVNNDIGNEEGGIFKTQFISKEDLQWLVVDLKNNKLPAICCIHFGLAEDEMKGNWWFEKNPSHALLANRTEVKNILKKDKNLLAVFSGHQHWTKKITEDGVDYYVVGSLTENINDDGVPDGVYFVIDIENDKIKVKEEHLQLNN